MRIIKLFINFFLMTLDKLRTLHDYIYKKGSFR
jgi:hypothetical protein